MRPPAKPRASGTTRVMAVSRARGRPGDKLTSDLELPVNSSFLFPKLSIADIQADMSDYNKTISKELLKAPSADSVREIFDVFVEGIYSKRPEDLAQPIFGCLDDNDYPDLYEEAIPPLHYLRQCQKMFTAANFDQFGFRDLNAPEKSRFAWQLSALINLNRFRQTRCRMYEELASSSDERAETLRVLREKKAAIQKDIAVIDAKRKEEEPELNSIKEKIAASSLELSSFHKEQQDFTKWTHEMKAALTQKNEQLAALKVTLMTEREELERMRNKVVSSPDRVQSELEEMKDKLETEDANIASMHRRTRILKLRWEGLQKACYSVDSVKSTLEACLETRNTRQKLQDEISEKTTKNTEFSKESASLKETITRLQRTNSSIDAKLARIAEQRREIDSQCTEEDKKLEEKSRQMHATLKDLNSQLKERQAVTERLQMELTQCVQQQKDEIIDHRKKQDLLIQKFNAFDRDMMRIAEFFSSSNAEALEDSTKLVENISI